MLKAELHTHIDADPEDKEFINYSAWDLIERAKELNFDVLAITCHDYVYSNQEVKDYAEKKEILLISGAELIIKGQHVLVYNITNEEITKINDFESLKELKKSNPKIFVIAPHPFHYKSVCLKNNVIKHLNLFDAWEYSFFYLKSINPNKKTLRLARKYKKPMVGNSDVHFLESLGKTYTLIDAKKNEKEIFQAIKRGKTKIKTNPLTIKEIGTYILNKLKMSLKIF